MKALWAFEPFHQDNLRVRGMHNLLKQIVGSPSNIEIGFIVTGMENELNLAFNIPDDERYSIYPRKCLKNVLSKAEVSIEDKKIHIKEALTFSNTKAVDALLSLAKSRGSDLIGVYTQSRHDFLDLFVGSFAKTIIHKSKLNLVLASPKTKFSPKLKNIFYCSDFASSSKKHLKEIIKISKKEGAKLTVFHVEKWIDKWAFNKSTPSVLAYRKKLNNYKESIEDQCKKSGVPCEIIISSYGPVSSLALKTAKKNRADIIVVSAKSGPLASLMGGSVTRQIIRGSQEPVLVLK